MSVDLGVSLSIYLSPLFLYIPLSLSPSLVLSLSPSLYLSIYLALLLSPSLLSIYIHLYISSLNVGWV
jgi:hypothetical protein